MEKETKSCLYYNNTEFYYIVNNLFESYKRQFEAEYNCSPDKVSLLNAEIERYQKLLGIIKFDINKHTIYLDNKYPIVNINGKEFEKNHVLLVRDWYLHCFIRGLPPQVNIDNCDVAKSQILAYVYKKYLDFLINIKEL